MTVSAGLGIGRSINVRAMTPAGHRRGGAEGIAVAGGAAQAIGIVPITIGKARLVAHGVTSVVTVARTRGDDSRVKVDSTTIAVVEGVGSGTWVADLAIAAIFGRQLLGDAGMDSMSARLLEVGRGLLGQSHRRVTVAIVTEFTAARHKSAETAVVGMAAGGAILFFFVTAGHALIVVQGGAVAGGAEIVGVDAGPGIEFVEAIRGGKGTKDHVTTELTGDRVPAVLVGTVTVDHGEVQRTVRIVTGEAGFGERTSLRGVAQIFVAVSTNLTAGLTRPVSQATLTQRRRGVAVLTGEVGNQEIVGAEVINVTGRQEVTVFTGPVGRGIAGNRIVTRRIIVADRQCS